MTENNKKNYKSEVLAKPAIQEPPAEQMNGREYLSPAEVAAMCGLSYGTVKRAIDLGELSAYRIGRRFFIGREQAAAFADARLRGAPAGGYTIRQLMEKLSLSYAYVSRLVKSGELPGRRVGRQYIISSEDFEAFMQSKRLPAK